MKVAIPSEPPGGLEAKVAYHFGRCDFYTVVDIVEGKISNVEVVQSPRATAPFAPPSQIDLLASKGVEAVLVKGIGPRAMQQLAARGIAVYMTSAQTVREAVDEIIQDKAKLATLEDACREAKMQPFPPMPPAPMPFMGFGRGWGMGSTLWTGSTSWGPRQKVSLPSGKFKVAVACQGAGGLDDVVSPMFARAPTFTIVEIEGNNIVGSKVLPNSMASYPSGAGVAVTQMLASQGVRCLVAGRFGPNAAAVAAQFGMQTISVPPGTRIREAINSYVLKQPR